MRTFRLLLVTLILILLIAAAAWVANWMIPRPIIASGGLYFQKPVILKVPHFLQGDPRWADELLAKTDITLGAEGCAVTSAAMVLAFYGADVDPARLNRFVIDHNGYTDQGWLYWESAAEFPPHLVEKAYENAPSYFLIDWNLLKGNPVIVRLRLPNGITHFVVIVGKSGWDYLTLDPGRGGLRGVYPLKDFGSPIEALRFYRKIAKTSSPANSPAASPK
ncbi:MAG: C39 family peptidase [Chthoniobacterales bacterium]